jgi:ABC-2 type transport system permease protein
VKNSTLAVFNQDGGAASIELVQRLAATQAFPQVLMLHSQQDMQQVIDRQQALLAISLPQDFSRRLASGQSVTAQAIIDGRRSNSAQIAYGYALQVVQQYAAERSRRAPAARCWCRTCTTPIWNTAGLCCPAWWPSSPPSAA